MITVVATVPGASLNGSTCATSAFDSSGVTGIVVALSSHASNPATGITDNQGPNIYTALSPFVGGFSQLQLFYCAAPTVGAGHIVSTVGGGLQSIDVFLLAGTDTTTFYDGVESEASPITPSEDNCILIAAFAHNSGTTDYTIDGGFVLADEIPLVGGQHFGIAAASLIQTTAASADPTWSGTAAAGVTAIAAFRSAAAPPVPGFDFTGDLGDFTLQCDEDATFEDVEPGDYVITEDPLTGWELVSATADGAYVPVAGGLSVTVAPGQTVTVTFTNAVPAPPCPGDAGAARTDGLPYVPVPIGG